MTLTTSIPKRAVLAGATCVLILGGMIVGHAWPLWAGRAEFLRDDVVLADGDVLFAPPLLECVVRATADNVFLGELEFVDTGEEINLYQAGPRVVAIRRGVSGPPAVPYEARAEWVLKWKSNFGTSTSKRVKASATIVRDGESWRLLGWKILEGAP